MKIVLCDDSKDDLQILQSSLLQYELTHPEYSFEIHAFSEIYKAIAYLEKNKDTDLLILDIFMPDKTGIDVAMQLREAEARIEIIFCTSSPQYALDAFSLHARQYLLKPLDTELLFSTLDKWLHDFESAKNNYLLLKVGGSLQKFWFDDILYSETLGNYQNLVLRSGEGVRVRMTSAELAKKLQKQRQFLRCGVSFIVNLKFTQGITPKAIALPDGRKAPIPRGAYQELKDYYFNYYFEEGEPDEFLF